MQNIILKILIIILIGEGLALILINIQKSKNIVLSQNTQTETKNEFTPTPSEPSTPSPTPIATSTPKTTPKLTPKPTKTPSPQPYYSSEQIYELINRFAGQYGVSPDIMRHIALCESGFNYKASNAGYAGLFQFGTTTWKNLRSEFGEDTNPDLRYNAEEAIQTAAYVLSKNKGGIWPNCYPN
ncbi:MAG: transglycosylase SLT domain-containing protein [Bacteroidales bacterium]|nr:transglycosylase SLT domain-containing protein [Bacteroidales bacterium]